MYKADVTFDELVRTLGLAYVWQVVGVLGVLSAFSTALSCVLAPVMVIAAILLIVAWFIAAKEALDLDWVKTIITVILYMSTAIDAGDMHGIGTSVVAAIGVLVGIAMTVFVSWLVMAKSEAIDKRLGEGRAVVTRLMGLIVMAIAVQFIINGIMDVTPEFVKIVDEARQVLMLLWYY